MNGNDVRGKIQASVEYGTMYYTMSYRPTNHDANGDFRRIHVTVKGHPEWTVLTKAGYYAMQYGGDKDLEHQAVTDLGSYVVGDGDGVDSVDGFAHLWGAPEDAPAALRCALYCEWPRGHS
ncbi:MAG TPA: hypothetical protein VNU92_13840 [Edaphobacter sp.]|jgi:hypothetical protein|nr:hypothetical protein [Edaphobacter sp.]